MGLLSMFIKIAAPVAAVTAWRNYRASHSSSEPPDADTGFSSASEAPGDDYPADEDVGRA